MKTLITVLLLILVGCTPMNSVTIHAEQNVVVKVELADTMMKRMRGLMNVSHLPENEGMLFIFPFQTPKSFWMKNTLIPLDLVFIDKNFEIVDIKEGFQPCTTLLCETYTSAPAKYVLEVNAGFSEKHSVSIGQTVDFSLQS